MVNDLKNKEEGQVKRPRGRPKGTAPSFSSVILVRNSIKAAMDECDRRGRPLFMLLADEMIESKTASFMTPEESYTIRGYAKGGRVDKDKMACNKPRRTPNHPKKSHVVKACEDGKEKIIRFGEQGAKTAGKPKAGESKRMKAKRKSFKARHRRNIKKGKMSAAYWADKTKW